MMPPSAGDLRENRGAVEVFDGAAWRWAMDLGAMNFVEAAIRLCAPLDATPAEIQRQVERAIKP